MNERLKALEKYNLWNGKRLPLGLQRTFYTDKINQFVGNQLVKVLVGQRRSGKSYLLRQTMAGLAASGVPVENILYINKEYLEFDFIDRYQDLEEMYVKSLSAGRTPKCFPANWPPCCPAVTWNF